MATDVKLPRLGQGMESGTIVKWLKAEGDAVEKGEPLFEVDTDKATQEVEAEASGVLLRISVASGEVPVGETIALIGVPGEAAEPVSDTSEAMSKNEEPPRAAAGEPPSGFRDVINGARDQAGGRVKASPLARRMARSWRRTSSAQVSRRRLPRRNPSHPLPPPRLPEPLERSSRFRSRTYGGRSPVASPRPGGFPSSSSPSRST
jgi:hypothetical protein